MLEVNLFELFPPNVHIPSRVAGREHRRTRESFHRPHQHHELDVDNPLFFITSVSASYRICTCNQRLTGVRASTSSGFGSLPRRQIARGLLDLDVVPNLDVAATSRPLEDLSHALTAVLDGGIPINTSPIPETVPLVYGVAGHDRNVSRLQLDPHNHAVLSIRNRTLLHSRHSPARNNISSNHLEE